MGVSSPSGPNYGQADILNGQNATEQDPNVGEAGQHIVSGQLRVKGSKSRYIGLGDWMALVDQVSQCIPSKGTY